MDPHVYTSPSKHPSTWSVPMLKKECKRLELNTNCGKHSLIRQLVPYYGEGQLRIRTCVKGKDHYVPLDKHYRYLNPSFSKSYCDSTREVYIFKHYGASHIARYSIILDRWDMPSRKLTDEDLNKLRSVISYLEVRHIYKYMLQLTQYFPKDVIFYMLHTIVPSQCYYKVI